MATQTLNYIDAIAHIPAGGTLILTEVPWDAYEQLLADLGDSAGVRVSYDQGRLEIKSPSSKHEKFALLIPLLVFTAGEELDVVIEGLGSPTYKQKWLAKGVEPDGCFYVSNAEAIIGKESIDLRTDPPPDIVVEIDISHESTRKLAIYAGMSVPEVWRYDGKRAHIHRLVDQDYVTVDASLILPVFTTDVLSRFLEQGKTEGQTATKRAFRDWLRASKV
jgi:Uma2 family endonuclease